MPRKQEGGVSSERLKSFIQRIETRETTKAEITADISDVYSEAGGTGFDKKVIRQIIRLRKLEQQKRIEEEELLDLYKSAIGMS